MEYSKGTTKEQWDLYHEELRKHNEFIKERRHHVDHICKILEVLNPGKLWSVTQISDAIHNEIDKSASMDSPNHPGLLQSKQRLI